MKKKTKMYLILLVIAAGILAATVCFELGSHGSGTQAVVRYLSDGLFTAAVLYIGCGALVYIQDAGNFYGVQFLFHTLLRTFTPHGSRDGEKKSYYAYCQEKKERKAAEGKSPLKGAMFLLGGLFLLLSIALASAFYRVGG